MMNPREAGFDGAKGINMNHPSFRDGGLFRLRRSVHSPWNYGKDCRNQLIWQESEPPHLYYCNQGGDWFELSFTPIQPE